MSGSDWKFSKGMNVECEEIKNWVKSGRVEVITEIKGFIGKKVKVYVNKFGDTLCKVIHSEN